MSQEKLIRLKTEAALLKQLLENQAEDIQDAAIALDSLQVYFEKVKKMDRFEMLGRIRLDRLFIEGELANYEEIANCYSRFANLAEGLEV